MSHDWRECAVASFEGGACGGGGGGGGGGTNSLASAQLYTQRRIGISISFV